MTLTHDCPAPPPLQPAQCLTHAAVTALLQPTHRVRLALPAEQPGGGGGGELVDLTAEAAARGLRPPFAVGPLWGVRLGLNRPLMARLWAAPGAAGAAAAAAAGTGALVATAVCVAATGPDAAAALGAEPGAPLASCSAAVFCGACDAVELPLRAGGGAAPDGGHPLCLLLAQPGLYALSAAAVARAPELPPGAAACAVSSAPAPPALGTSPPPPLPSPPPPPPPLRVAVDRIYILAL